MVTAGVTLRLPLAPLVGRIPPLELVSVNVSAFSVAQVKSEDSPILISEGVAVNCVMMGRLGRTTIVTSDETISPLSLVAVSE